MLVFTYAYTDFYIGTYVLTLSVGNIVELQFFICGSVAI